jgi:glutamate synthase (NADPH/NADH) small chain
MGCARCVVSCPTDALEIRDVRNLLRPALRQDATHLLRRVAAPELPRIDACAERLPLTEIQAQAARCLDCGEPTCRTACPLHNRIPEWLMQAAKGKIEAAAEIMAAPRRCRNSAARCARRTASAKAPAPACGRARRPSPSAPSSTR